MADQYSIKICRIWRKELEFGIKNLVIMIAPKRLARLESLETKFVA